VQARGFRGGRLPGHTSQHPCLDHPCQSLGTDHTRGGFQTRPYSRVCPDIRSDGDIAFAPDIQTNLDPADDMVLETALNGRAAALVTTNVKDFGAAERFRLPVLTPGAFLRQLREE